METRIKICGITRPQDATLAAELGAHAVGLNLVGGPRQINPARAAEIARAIPNSVTPVLLVTAANISSVHFDLAAFFDQFKNAIHQLYQPETMPAVPFPEKMFWAVFPVPSRDSLRQLPAFAAKLQPIIPLAGVLLDTASTEKLGGTGQAFNWNWMAEARAAGELTGVPPIILAGGLTPDNVAHAIRIVRPHAVDVSSGVEVPGRPGVKDPFKMRAFIQAVHAADAAHATL